MIFLSVTCETSLSAEQVRNVHGQCSVRTRRRLFKAACHVRLAESNRCGGGYIWSSVASMKADRESSRGAIIASAHGVFSNPGIEVLDSPLLVPD